MGADEDEDIEECADCGEDTSAEGETHHCKPDGYAECRCCGEVIVGEWFCASCTEAECEDSKEDEDAEDGGYYVCQIPPCPECEVVPSFMNDGSWHSNCDEPCPNVGKTWKA